ncbi:M6 family metalloprotease domain-containing protein [uncultured Imperialibacter sp.]|uniref:InlB B-repeat-containing protein n=1 Tax=uncultured Imperialibacter sp. TaxID=1672639 RepID=UPI0030DC5661|tara:strand:- start:5508 stop:10427 length:4920 start_codon:yes stop_codon:yes gene_type:complete
MRTSFKVFFLLAPFFVSQLCAQPGLSPSNCPASPYAVEVTQPDNSKLRVVGKGNMANHHTETEDGYTVVKNAKGIYEYAALKDGKLAPSGTKASNPSAREASSKSFLNSQPKHLRGAISKSASSNSPMNVNQSNSPGIEYAFPTAGTRKVLVILIKYPDLANTYTGTDFDDMMNEVNYNSTGSFRDYFLKVSDGELDVDADVFGWYTAENNYEYYGDENGDNVARELVGEAIDAAEAADVDFSIYDNDNDGFVDGVIIVHAGPGAEEGSQTQYIWSHRWTLPGSYGRTYDGVTFYDYMINPEIRQTDNMVGIGVFCHEFGHGLGLPDLYDIDDSNGDSEGIGNWGLMAGAGWLNNERTPGFMSAWSRAKLEWVSPTLIGSGDYSLDPSVSSTTVYKIATNDPKEYFLLENRQKTGQDAYLPGEGLAIWHIDDNKITNGDETHKLVDLEEADGLNGLDNETNRGDAGDLYPGTSSNTLFDDTSNPNAKLYSGSVSNIQVSAIIENDLQVSFTLLQGDIPNPCEDAISIAGTGSENSETFTGGGEGDWDLALCDSSAPGTEQIYSFTAPSTGLYSLEVTSATGAVDYAWNTACGPAGWVCIGDIDAIGTYGSMPLTVGETYYLLLDDEDDDTGSTHEFYINEPTTPCENITAITGTGSENSYTYASEGTGLWNTEFCDYSTPGTEQVYSFTPSETGFYSLVVTSATDWADYGWSTSCDEVGWNCIGDINGGGTYGFMEWTESVTYYVLIDAEDITSVTHEFYIEGPVGGGTVCENVIAISATGEGNTQTYSGAGTGQWSTSFCGFSTPGIEQVYSFTPSASGSYSVVITSANGWVDYAWGTSCNIDGWDCIGDIEEGGTYGERSLTEGVTYYLLLDSESNVLGTHEFYISDPVVGPCDEVIEITGTGAENPIAFEGGGTGAWSTNFCGYSTPGKEQIYRFVAPYTGDYSITVSSATDYVDYAWGTSCGSSAGNWSCIDDIVYPGTYGSLAWTAGTTYFLLLDDETISGSNHEFYINLPERPEIEVTPTSLTQTLTEGRSGSKELTIQNTGDGELTYSISLEEDWTGVDPASGTIEPGESALITVTFDATALTPNVYQSDITIASNDDDEAETVVTTSLTVEELIEYTISLAANPEEGGEVTGAKTYEAGETVEVTAAAAAGYAFLNWTEGATEVSYNAVYSFTATGDRSLVANFEEVISIAATASPSAGGTVTGHGDFSPGTAVSLTAIASEGYNFVDWTEGETEVSTETEFSFTASANRTLVANFQIQSFVITAVGDFTDGVNVTGGGTYNFGETVSLLAIPGIGYDFVNWKEDGEIVSELTSMSFLAKANRDLIAHFQPQTYEIQATPNIAGAGEISGAGAYSYLASAEVTATPSAGYSFVNWTENGQTRSSNVTFGFTVTGNRTLVANFELKSFAITTTSNPVEGGSTVGSDNYSYGSSVSVVATPGTGYNFVNWTENGTEVSTDLTYTFVIGQARNLVANFELKSFEITASASPAEGGAVEGTGIVNFGTTVTLTASPATSYEFINWTDNGSEIGTNLSLSFTAEQSRSLTANFEFNPSTSVKWEAELATVYPNPVTDYLTVEMDDFVQAVVFELTGKEIHRSTSKSLDLRDLRPGMYLIKLEDSDHRQMSFRVIKE